MSETCKSPFVLVSHGRTGSTYLSFELDRHPDVLCFRELYHPEPNRRDAANEEIWNEAEDPVEFFKRQIMEKRPDAPEVVGCKLFTFHCYPENQRHIWKWIAETNEIRIIWLERRNRLAAFLSETRARESNLWHPIYSGEATEYLSSAVEIEVDLARMDRYLERLEFFINFSENLLKPAAESGRILKFSTEDLAVDSAGMLASSLKHLGVSPDGLAHEEFVESGVMPSRLTIRNVDAVRDRLAERESEWMLEELGY